MKQCYKCKNTKPFEDFYKDKRSKDGFSSKCKDCAKSFKSKNFRTASEKYCARCENTYPVDRFDKHSTGDGYQTACKTCRSLVKRISKYEGLTWAGYHAMMESQDGLCKICQCPDTLVIDHCHKTGAVRGLLCQPCNMALGGFKDKIDSLKAAINYLEKK